MKEVSAISVDELREMSANMYDGLVNAVVDVSRKIVVVDADMHVQHAIRSLVEGAVHG